MVPLWALEQTKLTPPSISFSVVCEYSPLRWLVGELTQTLNHFKEFREKNCLRNLLEYRALWSHILH